MDYKTIILAAMQEVLSPSGYKKRGMHFIRSINDVVHTISLQSSTSSTRENLKVTVNVGVWIPALADGRQQPDFLSLPWRERIGSLMPQHRDHWWLVSSEQNAAAIALEIRETIQIYALPHLTKLETTESITDLWQSGISPGLTDLLRRRYLQKLTAA